MPAAGRSRRPARFLRFVDVGVDGRTVADPLGLTLATGRLITVAARS